MADIAKRLVGPQLLATANAVLYTAPPATTTIIRNIHLTNTTGTVYTFSLAINGTAATAANCLYYTLAVPASGAFDWSGMLVLAAGDTLQGLQSGGSYLALTVCGVEVS